MQTNRTMGVPEQRHLFLLFVLYRNEFFPHSTYDSFPGNTSNHCANELVDNRKHIASEVHGNPDSIRNYYRWSGSKSACRTLYETGCCLRVLADCGEQIIEIVRRGWRWWDGREKEKKTTTCGVSEILAMAVLLRQKKQPGNSLRFICNVTKNRL